MFAGEYKLKVSEANIPHQNAQRYHSLLDNGVDAGPNVHSDTPLKNSSIQFYLENLGVVCNHLLGK